MGQDEEALSLVREADFSRREQSRRNFVMKFVQVVADVFKAEGKVACDVLAEDPVRSNITNCPFDEGPEVSWVFFALSFARRAEGLARVTGNEEIHHSSKAFAWEGFKIRPDRGSVDLPRFHTARQDFAAEKFDLRVSDCAQISDNSLESHSNAAVSGAPFHDRKRLFDIIHIISEIPKAIRGPSRYTQAVLLVATLP